MLENERPGMRKEIAKEETYRKYGCDAGRYNSKLLKDMENSRECLSPAEIQGGILNWIKAFMPCEICRLPPPTPQKEAASTKIEK